MIELYRIQVTVLFLTDWGECFRVMILCQANTRCNRLDNTRKPLLIEMELDSSLMYIQTEF